MKKLMVLIIIFLVGYVIFSYRSEAPVITDTTNITDTSDDVLVDKITYNNATDDLIKVELPFPGAVTGKEFSVIGVARGNWFFEASFPIDVLDKDGNILVQTYASAQSEWMTTEFVPFRAEVKAPLDYIGPATLVLKKDNPSDMRELDASISFPFTIEY